MSGDDQRFHELWNDFIEGELAEIDLRELRDLMARNDQFPRMAADSYQTHRLLGLIGRESFDTHEAFVRKAMENLPADSDRFVGHVMQRLAPSAPELTRTGGRRWGPLLLTSVAVVTLLMGAVFWRPKSEPTIAHINGLSGSVLWTGDGGQVVRDIAVGRKLPGGTLEAMAPDSWAELEFRDGSTVTVSGSSMLTFSDRGQKELYLREGNISANVAPQPTEKPMLIRTRTAVLEVLGTAFKVEAELSATMLNVNQGRVRVKRLNDGSVVDVTANHRLVASADQQMLPVRVPDSVGYWKSRLQLGPQESKGKWLPPSEQELARMRAIPMVFTPPNANSLTLYLMAISISRGDSPPVVVQRESQFRIEGSIKTPSDLYFGFRINHANGEFAGKFLAHTPIEPSQAKGTFDTQFSVSDFRLDPSLKTMEKELPASPAGFVVADCWCFTINHPAGLEISSIELLPAAASPLAPD